MLGNKMCKENKMNTKSTKKPVMDMSDDEYENYVITDPEGFHPESIEELRRFMSWADDE